MASRSVQEVREELLRLMLEQVECLKAQTFGGIGEDELREHRDRLRRIREVSAELLALLKDDPDRDQAAPVTLAS